MSDGFLGRWSRRKLDARGAREPAPSEPLPAPPAPIAAAAPPRVPQPSPADEPLSATPAAPAEPAWPTLADVQALTPQSDFRPFMARGVAPEVKNAAVKKLFADPHFNVMDGLDTYIDDYTRPDPLPATMLRQLAAAQVMNLIAPEPPTAVREDAGAALAASVAESSSRAPAADAAHAASDTPGGPLPSPRSASQDHADTDLQLQPDHAARRPDAGPGTR